MNIAKALMKYKNCDIYHLLGITNAISSMTIHNNRNETTYFYSHFMAKFYYSNPEGYEIPEIVKYISRIHKTGHSIFEEYLKKTREFMADHNISTDGDF